MKLENLKYTDSGNFFLLAGPCVIEGEYMAMDIAEKIVGITESLQIPYIFKGSYRKANRSRLDSFTGIGDEKALKILRKVADTYKIPVVTDIHTAEEAKMAAEYVDVLQIPAFLCRQTDLLVAAAKTGRVVNIKKGQFLSPEAMKFAAQKVVDAGNNDGNFFRLSRSVGRLSGHSDYAEVRFPGYSRCYPFVAKAQSRFRRDRRNAGIDRDYRPGRYRCGCRWVVYGDSPRTV